MNFLNNLKKNNFTKIIYLVLVIVLFFVLFFIKSSIINKQQKIKNESYDELMVFVQDGCIHCLHAEDFLKNNIDLYKNIKVSYYNLKDSSSQVKLFRNISRLHIPHDNIGTPIFIMNNYYIIGFGEEQKSDLIQLLSEKKIK